MKRKVKLARESKASQRRKLRWRALAFLHWKERYENMKREYEGARKALLEVAPSEGQVANINLDGKRFRVLKVSFPGARIEFDRAPYSAVQVKEGWQA